MAFVGRLKCPHHQNYYAVTHKGPGWFLYCMYQIWESWDSVDISLCCPQRKRFTISTLSFGSSLLFLTLYCSLVHQGPKSFSNNNYLLLAKPEMTFGLILTSNLAAYTCNRNLKKKTIVILMRCLVVNPGHIFASMTFNFTLMQNWVIVGSKRPFPSSPQPPFESEAKC